MSAHVIIYGLGSAVVAALNFVLFAIYARHLRPEDYGAMSLIVTVGALTSMVGLMGMNNAVQRFFFDEKEAAGKRRVWGTGFVGGVGLTALLTATVALAARFFGGVEPALGGGAALVAFAAVVPQAALTWLQDFARLQFQPWRFAILGVVQAGLAGAVGLTLVVGFNGGLAGFFAGALVAAVITTVIAAVAARGAWPVEFSRDELRRLIRFGAPFVPAGLCIWATSAVLRWELVRARGLDEAGLFEVAMKLSAPVWMLNTAIGQAFGPYAFRLRAELPDYRERLVDIFHLIGIVMMITSCGVALFAREICGWIIPAAYAGAAMPCAVLAMGCYFSALHQVTALGIAFGEKPKLIAVAWGGGALLSFLLSLWLVPAWGATGGAWCMLAVYAGLNAFYLVCSQRLHPLPFRVGPVIVHVAVGLGTLGVVAAVQDAGLTARIVALKLGCWVVAVGLLLGCGGCDLQRVRGMVRNFTKGWGLGRGAAGASS